MTTEPVSSEATVPPSRFRRLRWWFDGIRRDWQRHREIVRLLPILRHGTEKELRAVHMPFPHSARDLRRILKALVKREHHYGTCVYAMSLGAEATFNYVSAVLGCTGFQASCADLDFLKRTRHMKHGFQILNYENLLYPQYADKFPTRAQVIKDNIDELGKAAEEMLSDPARAHPEVRRWWEDLVDMRRVHLTAAP